MLGVKIGAEEASFLDDMKIGQFGKGRRIRIKPDVVLKARSGARVEAMTRHSPGMLINLGSFSYVVESNPSLVKMDVGRYCSIATGLRILDGHHPMHAVTTSSYIYDGYHNARNIDPDLVYTGPRESFDKSYGNVTIGNDVWIGAHCTILAGTTIGNGAVVAGGANVVSDIPPYAVYGGNPARLIKYRFPEEICARLVALEWWNIAPTMLRQFNMYDPEAFCEGLERRLALDGGFESFAPDYLTVTEDGLLSGALS